MITFNLEHPKNFVTFNPPVGLPQQKQPPPNLSVNVLSKNVAVELVSSVVGVSTAWNSIAEPVK